MKPHTGERETRPEPTSATTDDFEAALKVIDLMEALRVALRKSQSPPLPVEEPTDGR